MVHGQAISHGFTVHLLWPGGRWAGGRRAGEVRAGGMRTDERPLGGRPRREITRRVLGRLRLARAAAWRSFSSLLPLAAARTARAASR